MDTKLHREELRKTKAYIINRQIKFEKKPLKQIAKKDWLTVKEVSEEFNISRKTFDRLREKGLEVAQPKMNGKILVERRKIINFLKQEK